MLNFYRGCRPRVGIVKVYGRLNDMLLITAYHLQVVQADLRNRRANLKQGNAGPFFCNIWACCREELLNILREIPGNHNLRTKILKMAKE